MPRTQQNVHKKDGVYDDDDVDEEALSEAAAAVASFAVGSPGGGVGTFGTSPSLQRAVSAADRFLSSQHARSGSHRGSLRIMQEVNLNQFPYPYSNNTDNNINNDNFTTGPLGPLTPVTSPIRLSLLVSSNNSETNNDRHSTTIPLMTGQPPSLPGLMNHLAPPPPPMTPAVPTTDNNPAAAPGVGGEIFGPTKTTSMRRAARELIGMAGNRSKRSIFDPRPSIDGGSSVGSINAASDGGIGSLLNDYDNDDEDSAGGGGGGTDGIDGLLEYWFPSQNKDDDGIVKNEMDDDDEHGRLLRQREDGTKQYGSVPPSTDGGSDNKPWTPSPRQNNKGGGDNNTNITSSSIHNSGDTDGTKSNTISSTHKNKQQQISASCYVQTFIQQASAVAIVGLLNMMIAIPFGASYFPIGWRSDGDDSTEPFAGSGGGGGDRDVDGGDVHGKFPIPGKEALGLRMFLFATMIAQLVFAFKSKFVNAVGLQMVENVPFLHALAATVISRQGYGRDALSTLFFLFGMSSVIVGLVFYLLGRMKLGKIVYFFPQHVLVGCIGGIGVFILLTAIEVTTNTTFDPLDIDSWRTLVENFHLLWVVLAFEGTLRFLMWASQDKHGRPKFQLLSPLFYILITPTFYSGLWACGISLEQARMLGYFFPSTVLESSSESSVGIFQDPRLLDIFTLIDLRTVSWMAVLESTGTMIALAAFSLIHVPINIPAFAISTDVETDMNAELIAHGWSNAISGIFGGLQNYMTYSNSVLYAKTGGKGLVSSIATVVLTAGLFVVGPYLCDYLPRCMAGTLLLHIGVDLVLEGVYDSWGQYDLLEYAGIWLITITMTVLGLTQGLVAGVMAALSTYAAQSINYQNPIRQILTATTLRSSAWTRCSKSRAILENERTGRNRILIFQLCGHLFFGNIAQLTDTIKDVLKVKSNENDLPIVVIIDFTLVNGMDSSAAHAVAKLKKILHRLFGVAVSIFVTGSGRGGFPCEFALSEALSPTLPSIAEQRSREKGDDFDWEDVQAQQPPGFDRTGSRQMPARATVAEKANWAPTKASQVLMQKVDGRVFESLDDALKFAEDILIAQADPHHEFTGSSIDDLDHIFGENGDMEQMINLTSEEERFRAKKYMKQFFAGDISEKFLNTAVDEILSKMTREEYKRDDVLWEQGSESDSMKIIVSGELVSVIEETGASEPVMRSNFVGELGLVQGSKRLTTLICCTERAILFSLSAKAWRKLKVDQPRVASLIDSVVIRYLAHRVQHVNNRYFHTTLPC